MASNSTAPRFNQLLRTPRLVADQNRNRQIYLGDDKFVEHMQCKISGETNLDEVPRPQKRQNPQPLEA
jgi:hypothetical protein